MSPSLPTTGNPERAFFYMDEMKALKIEPDLETFLHLFRSCAEVNQCASVCAGVGTIVTLP